MAICFETYPKAKEIHTLNVQAPKEQKPRESTICCGRDQFCRNGLCRKEFAKPRMKEKRERVIDEVHQFGIRSKKHTYHCISSL
mmetsp:Transcript_1955/g.4072  ORF Transcript_1955/g.4072 Transcript_1955/m.4072 type:complete len:84 (+) Transcript_1955:438-689(+)